MPYTAFFFACCLFPFLMTALGAAAVFFCPRRMHPAVGQSFLGFAAGVMIAASVWSLLLPALDYAGATGHAGWLCAAVGIVSGSVLLTVSDIAAHKLRHRITHSQNGTSHPTRKSAFLLELAMTLHNIPEGMAVGLALAQASGHALSATFVTHWEADSHITAAAILALGIGIQNLPEGAAVSLPRFSERGKRLQAFLHGLLSGSVEPIAAVLTALLFCNAYAPMPWLLSFAAGAMLHAAVSELIPAAIGDDNGTSAGRTAGSLGVIVGFVLMMALDVALG